MLRKLVVVLAVVACTLAVTKVTPRSRLPDYIDNMLHNNLENAAGLGREAGKLVAHLTFESPSIEKFLDDLSVRIQWADVASYVAIAQDLRSMTIDEVHSHYIFKAFPEEAVFRMALVNLYKTKDGKYGVVFGQDSKNAYGIMKTTTYHDMKVSHYGLPFESSTVLHQTGTHSSAAHEYHRNQLMEALQIARANQNSGLGFDIEKVTNQGGNFITKATEAYQKIAVAFKTVKTSSFKERIPGDGYSYYKSTSKFIRSLGIPHKGVKDFTARITKLFDLDKNPSVQKQVIENMGLITEVGLTDQQWSMNDLTFDINKGGKCDSLVFAMTRDYSEMKDHLLLTYVKGSFKLTPDTMIFQDFRSYAGGIYENTKDVIKTVARSISDAEIKAVHATMILSGLNIIAENLGISIKLPELKTIINNA